MSGGVIERLSAEDERMLALERGPVVGHTCKLLLVEPPPGDPGAITVAALRRALAARVRSVPRCTQCVRSLPRCTQCVRSLPRGLGRAVWVRSDGFDIANHVRAAPGVEVPLSTQALRGVVAALMTRRLDRSQPLWTLDVAPLEDGTTALIWRVHHCMADGFTALRIGGRLLWPSTEDPVSTVSGSDAPAAAALLLAAARDRARAAAAFARRAASLAGDPGRWRAAAGSAGVLPGTIRRELLPSTERSPLDAPLGSRRAVAWTAASLDTLRAAAKRVDPAATVNDAVVSLAAAGVEAWLGPRAGRIKSLRVRIPVSLHSPGDAPDAGNRDSFIDVDVPLHASMRERVLAVCRETAERKRLHDAEHLDALFRDVGRLPFGSHALAMTAGPQEFSLCVSNVPGPQEPLFVLGGRVTALYSIVEIGPRHALRVSIISAAGSLGFGLCANPDAVDPAAVARGIDRGVAELAAA